MLLLSRRWGMLPTKRALKTIKYDLIEALRIDYSEQTCFFSCSAFILSFAVSKECCILLWVIIDNCILSFSSIMARLKPAKQTCVCRKLDLNFSVEDCFREAIKRVADGTTMPEMGRSTARCASLIGVIFFRSLFPLSLLSLRHEVGWSGYILCPVTREQERTWRLPKYSFSLLPPAP